MGFAEFPGVFLSELAVEVPDGAAPVHFPLVEDDLVPFAGIRHLDNEALREPVEDFFVQPVMNAKKRNQDLFPNTLPDVIPDEKLVGQPSVEFMIAVKLSELGLLSVSGWVFEITLDSPAFHEEFTDLLPLAPGREGSPLPPDPFPKTRHGFVAVISMRCWASRRSRWTPWASSPATWLK